MALFENSTYLGGKMTTPAQTLAEIEGAATVNAAALASVKAEIPGWVDDVEAWNGTPGKGIIRDQLNRVLVAYENARAQALRLASIAHGIRDQIGTGGDPTQLPPTVPWSTGELQVAFGISGRPSAGKELGRYLVVEEVTWDALLSRAECDIAPSAPAVIVFSVSGVPIVRFSWAAGALEAVVQVLVAESVPGDVVICNAPGVQDATFAAIAGTLVGRRSAT